MKSSESENQKSNQLEKQFQPIMRIQSRYYHQYISQMTVLDSQSTHFINILKILKQNGFDYHKSFSFEFKKTVVRSSRDSAKYQIEYGHFKTFIYVSFSLYNFEKIHREEINKGKFGKILLFDYNKQQLIAKSFLLKQFNAQKLSIIIRQVFWVKFASFLKIGPKFMDFYGYDIICFGRSCEYLMELCQVDFQNVVDKQLIPKRLKQIIAIFHSIQAIYGDLKPDHIVWSQKQQSIVLVDFGMTKFIQQKIGQMTRTEYFGTYAYSCSEMKKAFILQSDMPVDLFYNDLYAVLECQYQLQQSISDSQYKKNYFTNNQWGLVANIFKFKFDLFQVNKKEVMQLFLKEKELASCFMQIIKSKYQEVFQQFYTQIANMKKQLPISHNKKFQAQSSADLILLEIIKSHNKPIFYNFQISEALIRKMYQAKTLLTFLESSEAIESLFEFLFQSSSTSSQSEKIQKLKIIDYIFLTKNSGFVKDQQNQSKKTRQVLLFFESYFYAAGNLEKLKIIENSFTLTCQARYLKKVQQNICEIFLKNPQLWLQHYIKGIIALLNINNIKQIINTNPRNSWEWLTTNTQIRKQFLSQNYGQLIEILGNLLKAIERKIAYKKLNIKCDQQLFQIFKVSKKKLLSKGVKIMDNIELVTICGQQFLEICGVIYLGNTTAFKTRKKLVLDLTKARQQKNQLFKIKFTFSETVWELLYFTKVKDVIKFEKYLEKYFESVFVIDMLEGIDMFVNFSEIFLQYSQQSEKTKLLMMNFLTNIQIQNILYQIKDDPSSLSELIYDFLKITKIFLCFQFDKKEVLPALDKIFEKSLFFIYQNSDQWWAVAQSEILILLQLSQVYYQVLKHNSWKIKMTKMIGIGKKILQQNYNMMIFGFIVVEIGQVIENQQFEESFDLVWEMLKTVQNEQLFFAIIERNYNFFLLIIKQLCNKKQFQGSLSIVEGYGRQLKTYENGYPRGQKREYVYFNISKIALFSHFVNLLPQNALIQMFIDKIGAFSLLRINQSPHLSLLFLQLSITKSSLFSEAEKDRCIRLICFGLSKTKIRYEFFIQINGQILHLQRKSIKFKNLKKQRLHYQRQARVSHKQAIWKKLAQKKQKKCIKLKKVFNNIINQLLKKIQKFKAQIL